MSDREDKSEEGGDFRSWCNTAHWSTRDIKLISESCARKKSRQDCVLDWSGIWYQQVSVFLSTNIIRTGVHYCIKWVGGWIALNTNRLSEKISMQSGNSNVNSEIFPPIIIQTLLLSGSSHESSSRCVSRQSFPLSNTTDWTNSKSMLQSSLAGTHFGNLMSMLVIAMRQQ